MMGGAGPSPLLTPVLTFEPRRHESRQNSASDLGFRVEAMGLEPTNLLTASQALYQLSYAPVPAQGHFSH